MWRRFIGSEEEDLLSAFDISGVFPNVDILFKVLLVLPVVTAASERSFSTLRRLKHIYVTPWPKKD